MWPSTDVLTDVWHSAIRRSPSVCGSFLEDVSTGQANLTEKMIDKKVSLLNDFACLSEHFWVESGRSMS